MNIIFKPECKTEIIEPTYDLPIIGEPISKTGASANNSNAYGVIVGIIGDGSSRRVRVMTEGYIDYDKVKENYMEYTGEAINALTGITLCSGGKLPTGVQPDWNQNDVSAPDYVKNRPFYTDTVETVLVEESTVSFADKGNGLYEAEFPSTFAATVGEIYNVRWDSTVYECTCVDFNGDIVIGNLSIPGSGSDTGEPFLMLVENGIRIVIYTLDTSASHTISISRFVPGVIKIDKKYLPEPDPEPHILITKSYSGTYSCNMTYDEIAELYAKYSDAIGLFDMRYNVFYFYPTGNEDKGTQYRCISVRHSDNFYFAFGFTDGYYYFEILIRKNGTIEENSNAKIKYMNELEFTNGYYPLVVKSSTEGSTKKFRITVDDNGTLTATEVTG